MSDSSITLRRALDLPPLRHARVLAGGADLERPIRHVNVMEVPDILPWVQADELLLNLAQRSALGDLLNCCSTAEMARICRPQSLAVENLQGEQPAHTPG